MKQTSCMLVYPECWWEVNPSRVPRGFEGRSIYCTSSVTLWWTSIVAVCNKGMLCWKKNCQLFFLKKLLWALLNRCAWGSSAMPTHDAMQRDESSSSDLSFWTLRSTRERNYYKLILMSPHKQSAFDPFLCRTVT